MADSYLGAGDLYFDRFTDTGVSTGFVKLGNCNKFELKAAAETVEFKSKGRDSYGEVIATATKPKEPRLAVEINQMDQAALEVLFHGTGTAVAKSGTTVALETVVAPGANKLVALANRGISAVTVTRKRSVDASNWTAETAYTAGTYVNTVTDADPPHFYKCTTAGTTGATEPTWPVNGGTVSDGAGGTAAVWTDQGVVTLVDGTGYDYDAAQARLGMLEMKVATYEGESLNVAYTYASETGYKITGNTRPTIKGAFRLDGTNLVTGDNVFATVYEAQLVAQNGLDALADGEQQLSLEGPIKTPTGRTEPFLWEEIDA